MNYIILFLLLLLGLYLFDSRIKGFIGELDVKMSFLFMSDSYKKHNNITLINDKTITQVDHIVVCRYGIFVIETKNYSGLITGSNNANYWTQYLGKRKFKFMNPIHQNYGHIKALEEILEVESDKFISIIAFTGEAKLKINSEAHVIKSNNLKNLIKSYRNEILTEDEVEDISCKLTKIKEKTTKEDIKMHLKLVKNKQREYRRDIKSNICPRCKGSLIIRKGKYGKFYGCSNFPKCRFVK